MRKSLWKFLLQLYIVGVMVYFILLHNRTNYNHHNILLSRLDCTIMLTFVVSCDVYTISILKQNHVSVSSDAGAKTK